MRPGVVIIGLLVALGSSIAWGLCVLDVLHQWMTVSGSSANYIALDWFLANLAIVVAVIGGVVALVGFLRKPSAETT